MLLSTRARRRRRLIFSPPSTAKFSSSRLHLATRSPSICMSDGDIGWVGFNRTESYTFDPNNRAVTGAFDFFGAADHEITEVMGRYGFGQNGGGGRDSPIDLFRYFSPGVRDLAAAYGSPNY